MVYANDAICMDLKVGGKWTITRTDGDSTYVAIGKFLEIQKPNVLKYTFGMPQYLENSDTSSVTINLIGESMSDVMFKVSGKNLLE